MLIFLSANFSPLTQDELEFFQRNIGAHISANPAGHALAAKKMTGRREITANLLKKGKGDSLIC